jgi:hypothetical protein
MADFSTLEHVAGLVIRRVLSEASDITDLDAALERAYPFGENPQGRAAWASSLLRHVVANRKLRRTKGLR